eukprot:17689-Amphidinium_carterae.1
MLTQVSESCDFREEDYISCQGGDPNKVRNTMIDFVSGTSKSETPSKVQPELAILAAVLIYSMISAMIGPKSWASIVAESARYYLFSWSRSRAWVEQLGTRSRQGFPKMQGSHAHRYSPWRSNLIPHATQFQRRQSHSTSSRAITLTQRHLSSFTLTS